MCSSCYDSYGRPAIVNDATRTAAELVRKVYEFSPVGGNCHIVTDDWNLEDENIRWCLDTALVANHAKAAADQIAAERACLEALLNLTEAGRASALALSGGLLNQDGGRS